MACCQKAVLLLFSGMEDSKHRLPLVQLLQEFAGMSPQQLVPTVPVHLSLPTKCTRLVIQFHAQCGSSPSVHSAPLNDEASVRFDDACLTLTMQQVIWTELPAWLTLADHIPIKTHQPLGDKLYTVKFTASAVKVWQTTSSDAAALAGHMDHQDFPTFQNC